MGGSGGGFVDFDVVVARFNADGTLDTTFGNGGTARLDLGTATAAGNRDSVWSMEKDGMDRLVVFAASKGEGARTDNDRLTVRLTAEGALDTTFNGTGIVRFDLGGLADNARHGDVESNGKIVLGGYTPFPSVAADGGTANQNFPVTVRLNANGTLDSTFGDGGVAVSTHPDFRPTDGGASGMVEVYALQRTMTGQYVTTGYARSAPAGQVDMVSLRLTETGVVDSSWNSNVGYQRFDLLGSFMTDDRGRDLALLPDGRPLVVGSACPTQQSVLDGMLLLLTIGGQLDTTFNNGQAYKLYNFMKADEAFFGAAVSPSGMQAAAVGYSGTLNNATDYDATLVLIPAATGGPAEFSGKVPLSATSNDRFFHVTFDAMNRPVAAGFVDQGGDTRFAVARFTPLGALDTTFGGGAGFVTLNVTPGGGTDETARAVVVQSNGKIVVAGVANH